MSGSEPSPRQQFRVWHPVLVRWGDMDAFGHVNNARYFTYCESARIRYFETIDLERFRTTGQEGPAVVTATCNFRRQLHYPASLQVGARATKIGTKSFTLEYAILQDGDDRPAADGSSVVVWVDYSTGAAIPLPDALKNHIRAFDGVESI